LVYLEGISNCRKVPNRSGVDHQKKTFSIAVDTVKEVLNKANERMKTLELDRDDPKVEPSDSEVSKSTGERKTSLVKGKKYKTKKACKKLKNLKLKKTMKRKVGRPTKEEAAAATAEKKLAKNDKVAKKIKKIKGAIGRPRKYPVLTLREVKKVQREKRLKKERREKKFQKRLLKEKKLRVEKKLKKEKK
jgi:hypothetical protein